jgi:hypothetical protein
MIIANIKDKKLNKHWSLVNVYGPAQDEFKDNFLAELSSTCFKAKHPLLLGGDFNILRFSSEKNKKFNDNNFSSVFNQIINSYELRELPLSGGKYTWSNNRNNPTLEKLDRVLISNTFESEFPLCNLRKIPRYMSDHNPLIVRTDLDQHFGSRPFCFENSWLQQPEFALKVKEIWNKPVHAKSAIDIWGIKMNRVRKFLKGWGQSLKGHTRKYKNILKKELETLEKLEEENMLDADKLDKKSFVQSELLRLSEEEEIYWHKRANCNWLLKGDNNTAFFHRVANGKKRKNTIFSLKHENQIIEGDEALVDHATNFYKNLFGPSEPSGFHMEPGCWDLSEKISEQEKSELEKPFEEKEIKNAIFSMEKNTAPGPDHFPVEFFQHCWDIIKEDVMALFFDFHNQNLDIGRLNYGVITLLPKVKDANNIKQYRPICLLNVVYKIFTKTLMLRLDKVMSRIINRSQSGFLKDRNIMDGILALHEILHDTKVKKRTG